MAEVPAPARRKALLDEARLQAEAIGRIGAWARLVRSLFAVGILLAWWGVWGGGPSWAPLPGIAVAVASGAASAVLRLGIVRARANVDRILEAAGAGPAPVAPGRRAT